MEATAANLKSGQGDKMQEKETLDERLPGLFEPDTLLPIQYFEAMRKKHLLEGEKRLILSVLEDAIECFMKCIDASTSKSQRLFREAEEWFMQPDTGAAFTFEYICETRGLDPESFRLGLRRWCERRIPGTRPERSGVIVSASGDADGASSPGGLPKIRSVSGV